MRSVGIRRLLVGAFVGVLSLGFAVAAAGAGHGTYIPAKLLFPFTMLAGVFGDSITLPYLIVALVQFPLYRFILGRVFLRRIFARISFVCCASTLLWSASCSHPMTASRQCHANGLTRRCS